MFRSLKKIASVVMATAMAVTTAVPGTAIVANAADTTMKSLVNRALRMQRYKFIFSFQNIFFFNYL